MYGDAYFIVTTRDCGGYILLSECSSAAPILLSAAGFTCTVSTQYSPSYSCKHMFDGDDATDWATRGQGVGAWLKVDFGGKAIEVSRIELRHRFGGQYSRENFKDIQLQLSNGYEMTATLSDHADWNTAELLDGPHVASATWLKITATGVHGAANNGFSEMRIYGCYTVRGNQ